MALCFIFKEVFIMKLKNVFKKDTMKKTGTIVMGICSIFVDATAQGISDYLYQKYMQNINPHTTDYDKKYTTLDDAVDAIVHSSMLSVDKSDSIAAIRNDGSREYYAAIINIANSSMLSNNKKEAISKL